MKKHLRNVLIALTASASPALAAGTAPAGGSFLTALFFGFVALIVVFQLVPAVMLLAGMVRAIFSPAESKEVGSAS